MPDGSRSADNSLANHGAQDVTDAGLDSDHYSGLMARLGIEMHAPST
jgi:hypothetical protein